jgi:hypothetical protein
MPKPLFRVNRYAHPKYKFLARAKVNGKWCRRYFRTEAEAIALHGNKTPGPNQEDWPLTSPRTRNRRLRG